MLRSAYPHKCVHVHIHRQRLLTKGHRSGTASISKLSFPNPSSLPVSHQAFTHTTLSHRDHRITTYRTNHPETNSSRRCIRAGDRNSNPAPYATDAIRLYTDLQLFYLWLWELLLQAQQYQFALTSAHVTSTSASASFILNCTKPPHHHDRQREPLSAGSRIPLLRETVASHVRKTRLPTRLACSQSNLNTTSPDLLGFLGLSIYTQCCCYTTCSSLPT